MAKISPQSIFLRSLLSIGGCLTLLALTTLPSQAAPKDMAMAPYRHELPPYLITLSKATQLEGKALGESAELSQIYQAFEQAIQSGTSIRPAIEQLLREATPAGRIYAAMLLVKLDPKAGQQALEQMRSDQTALTKVAGCFTISTTVGAEANDILQSRSVIF